MRVTVPGNLLLLGEYAVLESGGLGIALAPALRIRVTTEPGRGLSIAGSWPGGRERWSEGEGGGGGIFDSVTETCGRWLSFRRRSLPDDTAVTVDSSALFDPDGRKRGLGSSAAAVVGLTAALLRLSGITEKRAAAALPRLALEAHRKAQGGRGSGYDVYTSSFGGIGLFQGGRRPSWRSLELPWMPPLVLFRGEKSVFTGSAVDRYLGWKNSHPRRAREFLKVSNRAVLRFARSRSWTDAAESFVCCRSLSLQLGKEIGVDAEIRPPAGSGCSHYKSLGAGNEIGVCIGGRPAGEAEELILSPGGVQWQP